MTELSKLDVSLTKFGAHKVAILLRKYDKDEVLAHLEGSEPGVNIELAQTKKNLSASGIGGVPELWNEARQRGSETIDALVLVAIILSHHQLIEAVKCSTAKSGFAGTVNRGQVIDGKPSPILLTS